MRLEDKVLFAIEDIDKYVDDDDPELAIAHVRFLSTAPNSHGITITEEMLRRDAPSILGKFLVGKMNWLENDTEGHEGDKQKIMGYFPAEQEVQFEETDEGYIVASADAVISKLYATSYYNIFVNDNKRNVSVEMLTKNPIELEDGSIDIEGFHICGVTSLGKKINGSCPDANIVMTRFSEDEANEFYHKQHNSVSKLQKFATERRAKMAEEKKSYKINKTELKEIDWGGVDKAAMRDKIMEAKNRNTLVKAVYALVEDGWEDAPSEHLKYPLMAEIDGTFYYVKEALSSALAYAKQHNEQDVIDKVEKLYKKFDLDDSEGKEEEEKMENVEFAAVEIGDLWGRLWDALHEKYPDGEYSNIYCIDSIWEEDNKKFAIIYRRDEDIKYRLDFSLTEEGLELSDEIVKVEIEIVETDEVKKFAEPEDIEKYQTFAEVEVEETPDFEKMLDEANAKIAELNDKIEEQCNIVMEKDKKIEELQAFKAGVEEQQKMCIVNETLAKIKGKVDDDAYANFVESGKACEFAQVDTWKNGIYAKLGEIVLSNKEEEKSDFMHFELPTTQKKSGLWD